MDLGEAPLKRNIASGREPLLLKVVTWIRRQQLLRAFYRLFPPAFRNRVSWTLAAPARKRLSFPVTAAWGRGVEPRTLTRRAAEWRPGTGVNIFAYFRGQFGLAESARLYARALMEAGFPVALYDIDLQLPHEFGDRSMEPYLGTETPYGIHLIFVNPDYLEEAFARIGKARLEGGYVIACWFWELETIPENWLPAIDLVDEILVSSAFVEAAFRRSTNKPILRVPLPIEATPDSGLQRADLGLRADAFVFLVTFDFSSWLERKNPLAAIEAFKRAFPSGDENVQLLVKSTNGHRYLEPFLELMKAAGADPRIVLRDQIVERHHIQAIQRCADAYVSLHRAEGFGLGMAESMLLGKPVVATAWSGNVDFMDENCALMVGYQLKPVLPGQYSHTSGQHWADADVDQAAAHMRRLWEDPALAGEIGVRAQSTVGGKLSPPTVANQLIQRLTSISEARTNAPKVML